MLITLGRYLDPWEAHVLRARLEAEGIPAYVSNDSHVLANWSLAYALGGVALQVPAERESEARATVVAINSDTTSVTPGRKRSSITLKYVGY